MNRLANSAFKLERQSLFCPRCYGKQKIRHFLKHFATSSSVNGQLYHLKSRGLVQLRGKDVIPFLQGLVTNDVEMLGSQTPVQYTMLLNVQGRVMYDLLLYDAGNKSETERNILIECDRTIVDSLISGIKKYKLRKKVTLDNVSDSCRVLASDQPAIDINITENSTAVTDPRVPAFGTRIISNAGSIEGYSIEEEETDYQRRRLEWGIPEGVIDLPPGNCLPLESNLVYMNGVSFSKGCYLGQELTARTHHTGVTRKRLMPIFFQSPPPEIEQGENILNEKNKNVGKFRSCIGTNGLGLLRLAEIAGTLQVKSKSGEKVTFETRTPEWWPKSTD